MATERQTTDVAALREQLAAVEEHHRQLSEDLTRLRQKVEDAVPVQDLRKTAVAKLRGRLSHVGDVISPVDAEWNPEE